MWRSLFIGIGVLALAGNPAFGTLENIIFQDSFDDGNFDGWIGGDPEGHMQQYGWYFDPLVVVPGESPDTKAVAAVTPSLTVTGGRIHKPIGFVATELCVEFRAKSVWGSGSNPGGISVWLSNWAAPSTPSYALEVGGWNNSANWYRIGSTPDQQFYWTGEVGQWHTYAFTRDSDGWWSLAIDDDVVSPNFRQDINITAFNDVGIQGSWQDSQLEWVTISTPEPATLGLLALAGLAVLRRKR